ncbi:MAG: bile acid:sodium symporter family protein [Solirubrobacterales bacterium]
MEDSLFATVLLPAALAVIMVSLGLSLTVDDFRRVVVYPRGVTIGLANLVLISPLLAFAVAEAYSLDPALAVGLILLGASPGGTTANLLTHLARGDTALSITMTAISSVAAVITVPLFLELATTHFGASGLDEDVSMLGVVARVLLITVIPLSLGMWLRARRPSAVASIEGTFRKLALAVFVAVVVGVIVAEHDRVLDNLDDVAAAAITLNVAAMAISFAIARAARLDDRQSTAIAIELGIHNSTLAIAVGAAIATVLTIPAAVYASFMFITAGLFARVMYRRNGAAVVQTASRG